MSGSLDAWGKRMEQFAVNVSRAPADIATANARAYKNAIQTEIGAQTVGFRLRGVGKRGARVGVRYSDTVVSGAGTATVFVQATGPLHLLERDNAAHEVPRATRTKRARTRSGRLSYKRIDTGAALSQAIPMLIPGVGWRTGPWKVRGSKGKHPFEKGTRAAERQAFVDSVTEFQRALRSVFR